eukprot:TRINITY_DN10105_c0_g2_i1.p1 TRINITY_DN10105_c0_g2~~TRINITY_DN10105_c0_g2_i1.p1  ORF type:complete len:347 (+),score=80.29 TRINITY_DN10105_c0_g2_i1:173-1213(+)
MGALCMNGQSSTSKESNDIERSIKEDRKVGARKFKLLLLGTGDSGKSTFCKQMQILHAPEELPASMAKYQGVLRENTIYSSLAIFDLCEAKNIKLPYEFQAYRSELQEATVLTPALAENIQKIWEEKDIKEAFEDRASCPEILSSSPYYFENATRFAEQTYQPTEKDITMAKLRTCGVIEITFTINNNIFTLIDVGGQKTEQRKWIHCFENVMAVIYLIALDEYDMTLEEDSSENRFDTSLKLFREVTGSKWFSMNTCILFLNKSDLFAQKIQKTPLYHRFPELTADANYDSCLDFIKNKYMEAFKGSRLYMYPTCAIDKSNCETVFKTIQDSCFMMNLEKSGFSI